MNKKIILIILVIALVLGAVFAYWFLTKNKYNPPADPFQNLTGFLPISEPNTNGQGTTPAVIGGSTTTDFVTPEIPRLRKIWATPVAGSTILEKDVDVIKDRIKTKEKQYSIRFIDRGNGHIYDARAEIDSTIKISNTTIPKVYEATFLNAGNSVITRFLNDTTNEKILTYLISIKDKPITATVTSTTTATTTPTVESLAEIERKQLKDISGVYLNENILQLAVLPGNKILTLAATNDNGIFDLLGLNGKKIKTVLSHPFSEWLIYPQTELKEVVVTKPSGYVKGYAYSIDTNAGTLKKIIGNLPGLTLLPKPDGISYLGAAAANGIQLFIYSSKTEQGRNLSFASFPEKCAWMKKERDTVICAVPSSVPQGVYPDDWYKGAISFIDNIWKINTTTGQTTLISVLATEAKENIDMINLNLSSDDKYLTFNNKKDLSLWSLDLSL